MIETAATNIKVSRDVYFIVLKLCGTFNTYTFIFERFLSIIKFLSSILLFSFCLRPLLFDISPDVNEYRPNEFTFKIGPTIYEDPFETSEERDPCFANELKREAEHVDLGELYKEYKTCKVRIYILFFYTNNINFT